MARNNISGHKTMRLDSVHHVNFEDTLVGTTDASPLHELLFRCSFFCRSLDYRADKFNQKSASQRSQNISNQHYD